MSDKSETEPERLKRIAGERALVDASEVLKLQVMCSDARSEYLRLSTRVDELKQELGRTQMDADAALVEYRALMMRVEDAREKAGGVLMDDDTARAEWKRLQNLRYARSVHCGRHKAAVGSDGATSRATGSDSSGAAVGPRRPGGVTGRATGSDSSGAAVGPKRPGGATVGSRNPAPGSLPGVKRWCDSRDESV